MFYSIESAIQVKSVMILYVKQTQGRRPSAGGAEPHQQNYTTCASIVQLTVQSCVVRTWSASRLSVQQNTLRISPGSQFLPAPLLALPHPSRLRAMHMILLTWGTARRCEAARARWWRSLLGHINTCGRAAGGRPRAVRARPVAAPPASASSPRPGIAAGATTGVGVGISARSSATGLRWLGIPWEFPSSASSAAARSTRPRMKTRSR